MRLLVCGHITRDLIRGDQRLGGAASFAARAAGHFGVDTSLLTSAPAGWPDLAAVRDTAGLSLELVESGDVTTFELTYLPEGRRLRLLARARTLGPAHLPPHFFGADVAYVAPVAGECGPELVAALRARFVAVGLQGFLRTTDADGLVRPRLDADLEAQLAGVHACIFSVEDHPEAERIAERLAAHGVTVALTRAARGASLYARTGREDVPAAPAVEVDPTGAGDVFGVVFSLALARGLSAKNAAERAALAAARVVEGPGLGNLPSLTGSWHW